MPQPGLSAAGFGPPRALMPCAGAAVNETKAPTHYAETHSNPEVIELDHVLQRGERKRSVWALGSLVSALATPADTDGAFEALEYTAREGDSAPIHAHPNSWECFHVIEGQLAMLVGEEECTAPVGSFSFVPPGERHAFRVISPTATFLQFMTPGGIFSFFEEIGEPAPSATLPPVTDEPWDVNSLLEAMERHGMEVLGPPLGME